MPACSEPTDTAEIVNEYDIAIVGGGIVGLGEDDQDRIGLIHRLAALEPQPESVPVNALVRVEGTPLAEGEAIDPFVIVRTVACARILMPHARVRLSAGRTLLSEEAQALCFFAGANSIFYGEKLLTTSNPEVIRDRALLANLGLGTLASNPELKAPAPVPDLPLSPVPVS